MYFSLTEDVVLAVCVLLYVIGFIYFFIRPFLQERKLKRTEFRAEIDMLSEKNLKKRKEKENHFS
jgi:hypothetical protein